MATGSAAVNVSELEEQAAEERKRMSRDLSDLRQSVRRTLDARGRVKDGIHANPRGFYGTAAGTALFAGYVLARILKA